MGVIRSIQSTAAAPDLVSPRAAPVRKRCHVTRPNGTDWQIAASPQSDRSVIVAVLEMNGAALEDGGRRSAGDGRNPLLLIDSDKKTGDTRSKLHKERLLKEVDDIGGYAWVTDGKEVENYIPVAAFRTMFTDDSLTGPAALTNVLDYHAKHAGNKTRIETVELARRVVPLLTRESLAPKEA